eukprot:1186767-Prorocentrum_minimum.AAC.1
MRLPLGTRTALTTPPSATAPLKTTKPQSFTISVTETNSSPYRVSGLSQPYLRVPPHLGNRGAGPSTSAVEFPFPRKHSHSTNVQGGECKVQGGRWGHAPLHCLGIGEAGESLFVESFALHLLEHPPHHLLHHGHEVLHGSEGELHVQLRELWLAVRTQVLVAEAPRNLPHVTRPSPNERGPAGHVPPWMDTSTYQAAEGSAFGRSGPLWPP